MANRRRSSAPRSNACRDVCSNVQIASKLVIVLLLDFEARLHESLVHLHFLRYIWLKKIGRTRGSAARGCANAAPAAMPPATKAREGCSGLVGDACARQLLAVYYAAAGLRCEH